MTQVDLGSESDGSYLAGEVVETRHLEDVEHWISVYAELLENIRGLGLPSVQLQRLQARLAFWQCRRDELLRDVS